MSKPLVLYHGGCWDGFCAAWVARKALGDVEAVPVQYGQEPPGPAWQGGRQVYVLDFSYPRETMLKLADTNNRVVVLDHHKTAQAALDGLKHPGLSITFDMAKSGNRLTWEYFFPGQEVSWLVQLTEDRDLWRWKLPSGRKLNAWLRSLPMKFEDWDLYDNPGNKELDRRIDEGSAILRREQQMVADHVGFAREIEMDGHKILAVNATVLISEIAGELAKDRPFGACWFRRADGKDVWSLRSREGGIDVSEIAKRRGGGGHKQAAGFECDPSTKGK